MRVVISILILFIGVSVCAQGKEDSTANDYCNKGDSDFFKGNYKEAVQDFNRAIAINPLSWFYSRRAGALAMIGQYRIAIGDIKRALLVNEFDATLIMLEGHCYARLGSYDTALTFLLRADFHTADYYYDVGLCYEGIYQYFTAIGFYSKAVVLDPSPVYYLCRGRLYRKTQESDLACADYFSAIRIAPNDGLAYDGLGHCYIDEQKYDSAIHYFNIGLRFEPSEVSILVGRGVCYANLQQYQRAIDDFDAALKIDPTLEIARTNRQHCYEDMQEKNGHLN